VHSVSRLGQIERSSFSLFLEWTNFPANFSVYFSGHDFLFCVQFSHLNFESCSVFCVGFLTFRGIFQGTLVTNWLGYFLFGNSLVLDGDIGTAAKFI
jgi:hypothetical protein